MFANSRLPRSAQRGAARCMLPSGSEVIGRAGSSASSCPGKITFLWPKCVSGVLPAWVHS